MRLQLCMHVPPPPAPPATPQPYHSLIYLIFTVFLFFVLDAEQCLPLASSACLLTIKILLPLPCVCVCVSRSLSLSLSLSLKKSLWMPGFTFSTFLLDGFTQSDFQMRLLKSILEQLHIKKLR
ncbi:unnamed protein product [Gadus morhua 'NCC']